MKKRQTAAGILIVSFAFPLLSACMPVDVPSCESAFAEQEPLEDSSGLEFLIPDSLVTTLDACHTAAGWVSALQANPEVVGHDSVSESDALIYLKGVCEFLPNSGSGQPACREATTLG